MLPRRNDHHHAEIQRLTPVRLVDLRDYGLAGAAPSEDGRKMLIFRLSEEGALVPAS